MPKTRDTYHSLLVYILAQFLLSSLRSEAALNYTEHNSLGRQYTIQQTHSLVQRL